MLGPGCLGPARPKQARRKGAAVKAIVGSTWFARGGVTESEHRLEGVIVGADERLRLGENATADRLVCLRSTAKPFQALLALRAGAAERFGLTAEHIAVACGTHVATDRHTSLAR